MKKTLVAYFSASGVTKKVALKMADAIGADTFEIEPAVKYTRTDLNWMDKRSRSTLEMQDRSCRPAMAKRPDLEPYELILVGFPVWWYREPSIIDTFMESADFTGKTVVPFCTSGGSGLGDSAENMQALARNAKVLNGRRFSASASAAELKEWALQF
ncbi:MAG: flavodoxin [Clostridia bacterium]|nr:flavodoxin [Clostridia bacterium]MBQ2191011.1 flavodoxin [Clostridia bacterium]MBQ3939458.1 flavodoxin [Clostridia bacterium]